MKKAGSHLTREQHERIAELRAQGMIFAKIAAEVGCSETSASKSVREGMVAKTIDKTLIIRLIDETTMSGKAIARAAGCSLSTVSRMAKGRRVLRPGIDRETCLALLADPDMTFDKIADQLGCSWSSVRRLRAELDLPPRRRGRKKAKVEEWSRKPETLTKIAEFNRRGWRDSHIAAYFGVHRSTVSRVLDARPRSEA